MVDADQRDVAVLRAEAQDGDAHHAPVGGTEFEDDRAGAAGRQAVGAVDAKAGSGAFEDGQLEVAPDAELAGRELTGTAHRKAPVGPAAHLRAGRVFGHRRQHVLEIGQVVDRMQQHQFAQAQGGEGLGAPVEEVVDQRGRHHRVGGGVEALGRPLQIGQGGAGEVVVEIFLRRQTLVAARKGCRGGAEIEVSADGGRAVDEVVVADRALGEAPEAQDGFVEADMPRIDGDDEVPRIELQRGVLVHELEQRQQNAPAGGAEATVDGERRHFGNVAAGLADGGNVENALHRKTHRALANQRDGGHHAVAGAAQQRRGGGQGMIDGGAQAGRVGLHEAGVDVGFVEQMKAGLELFAGFRQFEDDLVGQL